MSDQCETCGMTKPRKMTFTEAVEAAMLQVVQHRGDIVELSLDPFGCWIVRFMPEQDPSQHNNGVYEVLEVPLNL